MLGSELETLVKGVLEGERFPLGGLVCRHTGHVDHHGDPGGDVEVGVLGPLAVVAQLPACTLQEGYSQVLTRCEQCAVLSGLLKRDQR